MAESRSVAGEYHRLTKYTEENIRSGPGLDWSNQPRPFKEIVSKQRISLRPYLPFRLPDQDESEAPAPAPAAAEDGPGLAQVSRLLCFTNGVTGLIRFPQGGGQLLRAAPSAGALYPTEIYVASRGVPGLDAGVYNYQVHRHELVRLWEGDQLAEIENACGGEERLRGAPLCLLFTGVYWRSAWRYQERGYRRVLLDTGHAVANLAAYAAHEQCNAQPLYGFVDSALNGLFFFDDAREAVLVCAAIGEQPAPSVPGALWPSASSAADDLATVAPRSEDDLAGSATVALHRATSCEGMEPERPGNGSAPVSDRSIPLEPPGDVADTLPDAILHRRSARAYGGGSIPLRTLGRAIGFAFGRAPSDPAERPVRFRTHDAGMLRAHVAALAVDGLDDGIYAVEGVGEALLPLAIGSVQRQLHRLSLGQDIAQRCAATLIFSAPAEDALLLYGDRAYRYLHLEAGAVGQRFQLAAQALGMSACGIGGFFDDQVANLIECPTDDFVLYLVTIGRAPQERH